MRKTVGVLASVLLLCACETPVQAYDREALDLLKVSLSCSSAGFETSAHGFATRSKVSYQYTGDAVSFKATLIERSIGQRNGLPVEINAHEYLKVFFKDLQISSISGSTVSVKCKRAAPECIDSTMQLIKDTIATRNVVDETKQTFAFHFCSSSSAQDFGAALEALGAK